MKHELNNEIWSLALNLPHSIAKLITSGSAAEHISAKTLSIRSRKTSWKFNEMSSSLCNDAISMITVSIVLLFYNYSITTLVFYTTVLYLPTSHIMGVVELLYLLIHP